MALTLPWIFKFGRTEEIRFFYSMDGYPFHLWFLWHLLIFAVVSVIIFLCSKLYGIVSKLTIFQFIQTLLIIILKPSIVINQLLGPLWKAFPRIIRRTISILIISILISILIIPTAGELTGNPIVTGIYFILGYLLYTNVDLFESIKRNWIIYLSVGLIAFALFFTLEILKYYEPFKNLSTSKEVFIWLVQQPIKVISALFLSYGFIGLVETKFRDYSFAKRFISDGAYWMYLIHLPIVTFITFYMFRFDINPMFKFIVAILLTSGICLVTYKYIVRPTFIGTLLNGKRS